MTFEDDNSTLSQRITLRFRRSRKCSGRSPTHDGTMVNAVIAWELVHPALTGAIIGVRKENEAREMIEGTSWKLTSAEMSAIQNALEVWEESRVPAG